MQQTTIQANRWDVDSIVDHSELINYTDGGHPVIKQHYCAFVGSNTVFISTIHF
jgi:hypothetical protein